MEMGLPVVNVNHWQNLVYVSVASTLNLIHVAAPAIITLSFSLLLPQHYWALVAWRFVNAFPPPFPSLVAPLLQLSLLATAISAVASTIEAHAFAAFICTL